MSKPPSRRRLWYLAIKPPMYTVAISPITIGSLAAYVDHGTFSPSRMFVFLLAAVLIIAWTNLTNDVFDFDTGIDVHKAESVVNLLGATRSSRNLTLLIANLFLSAAFLSLATISTSSSGFDPVALQLIAIAVAGGYIYQGPPFRLGYFGLGEPITFITWTLGVCAAYYSQVAALPGPHAALRSVAPSAGDRVRVVLTQWLVGKDRSLLGAALLVAIATTIILFCSHFHQIDDDRAAGKTSPIVLLGTHRASQLLIASLISFAILHIVLFRMGLIPTPVFWLAVPSLRYAYNLASFVRKFHNVPAEVRIAKYYATQLHFVHGSLVAFGYILAATSGR